MTWQKRAHRGRSPVPGDIVAALGELGFTEIHEDNGEVKVLCPYHNDHSIGTFSINAKSGVNHCFSCGESGQFVRVVETVKGWGWEKSALWCQTRALKGAQRIVEPSEPRSGPVDTTQQINEASLALFTDPPERELAKRNISLDAAREYGVLWDQDGWILPIRDPETGELWGWQKKESNGRVRNRPRAVNKSRTLYGLQAAGEVRTFVLVESPLDCVRLRTAGIEGGVSSYGVHVSVQQLDLLARADRVVLALDNDEAGARASADLCHHFKRVPLDVYNYGSSRAKDPGEQSDIEIAWGMANATAAFRTRF